MIDTNLHEMGHGILPVEDPDIVERVGKTNEAAILEELKAEAASFVILQNYMAGGKDADIEGQVLTKIAVLLSYVLNASPEEGSANERYYYTGVIILNELMDKGVLQKKGGTYSVGDPKQAVEVIASMGNGIIKEYYENKNSNPKIVEQKFKELRRLKDKPEIAELIKSAREAQAK